MPLLTEGQQLERRIVSRFHRALSTYQMLTDGDYVLIAVSGGFDSLCLLELLGRQMKIARPAIRLAAIHVRMENIHYATDTDYLQRFADEAGVPLHIVTTRFDASTDKRKTPCFLCSWMRRKQMFNLAQQLGCNKIALGHHQDDIIHTALMNQFFQGHFSTMPVRLQMRKMPLTIIRPLCLESETDIKQFASAQHYVRQQKLCPYETDSHRDDVKQLFRQVEEMNPEARYSIWHALETAGKLTE